MSTIEILNQDKNTVVVYDREKNEPTLHTEAHFHIRDEKTKTILRELGVSGWDNTQIFSGINLLAGEHLLGTFNSVKRALAEIRQILSCKDSHYSIRGYSAPENDEEFDEIKELLRAIAGGQDEAD